MLWPSFARQIFYDRPLSANRMFFRRLHKKGRRNYFCPPAWVRGLYVDRLSPRRRQKALKMSRAYGPGQETAYSLSAKKRDDSPYSVAATAAQRVETLYFGNSADRENRTAFLFSPHFCFQSAHIAGTEQCLYFCLQD